MSHKKALFVFFLCSALFMRCNKDSQTPSDGISVELSDSYELSNIILALTNYGKTDPWEVRKGFDYYDQVLSYFEPFQDHPLLDSVNYSRKRWKEYLSFRTDAYAFSFNKEGILTRSFPFYSNGKQVTPFDDHLELINDFIQKTNFQSFFEKNQAYYTNLLNSYRENYLIDEMRAFLTEEFSEDPVVQKKYKIIVSPFVYRMNCHRTIDSITEADFPTLPDYIIHDSIPITPKNKAIESHTLFTEMDHAYVNPVSSTFKQDIKAHFKEAKWNEKSGYEKYELGVFNEYMTWAVYDLFLMKKYPEFSDEISLYWQYQNDRRGFIYSKVFSDILKSLYKKYPSKSIDQLYPMLIDSIALREKSLTKPIVQDYLVNDVSAVKKEVTVTFSEAMKRQNFDVIYRTKNKRDTLYIDGKNHQMSWSPNGKMLQFTVDVESEVKQCNIYFNWWGVKNPLESKNKVLLRSASKIVLKNEE